LENQKFHKMAYEIERKFLVKGDFKSHSFRQIKIKQGYLSVTGTIVRVRTKDREAFITIKNAPKEGSITRHEWEYEIPVDDAEEMLRLCCDCIIDKTRYLVGAGNHIFEVDEFFGSNEGLVIAEVELRQEDEPFERPEWLGEEVTGDVRYYNSYLWAHPYAEWK
jgi:CYTH domain-containing protein